MNRWLMDHWDGEWLGNHHDWRVPAAAQEYLIFTTVRNPYDKAMSGWFAVPWSAETPEPARSVREFAAEMHKSVPLRDGTTTLPEHNVSEVAMNQHHYVKKSGASLALHFERLPDCLSALPFVNEAVPPFPHRAERGVRPPGSFFDHFQSAQDEAAVWAYAAEDFATFGYERFNAGLPASAANAIQLGS